MISSVLIVEDNDNDSEFMCHALSIHVPEVRRVRSLSEGVEAVKHNEPDVVLLDVGGIGADSPHHAISEIKKARPTAKAAIVVISGNSNPVMMNEGIMSTASGWIVKGRWENLMHEVRSAFQNHYCTTELKNIKAVAREGAA